MLSTVSPVRLSTASPQVKDLFRPQPPPEPEPPPADPEPSVLPVALSALGGTAAGAAVGAGAALLTGGAGAVLAIALAACPCVVAAGMAGALASVTESEGLQLLTGGSVLVGGLVGAGIIGAAGGFLVTLAVLGGLTGMAVGAMVGAVRQEDQQFRQHEQNRPLQEKFRQDMRRYDQEMQDFERDLMAWEASHCETANPGRLHETDAHVVVNGVVVRKREV